MSTHQRPTGRRPQATFGSYLQDQGLSVEQVRVDHAQLWMIARELLLRKGIATPTTEQVDETLYQLEQAIKTDRWRRFSPPYPRASNDDGLERPAFSGPLVDPTQLKLPEGARALLTGDFESGRVGQLIAGCWSRDSSVEEEEPWRGLVRAHTYLRGLPLEALDLEHVREVHRLLRAGRPGGGAIRRVRRFLRPRRLTPTERDQLAGLGLSLRTLGVEMNGRSAYTVERPPPHEVAQRLEALLRTLTTSNDPLFAAARYERAMEALHPFGVEDATLARLVVNRLLDARGYFPAVWSQEVSSPDLIADELAWCHALARGCARTRLTFFRGWRGDQSALDGPLLSAGIRAVDAWTAHPVVLEGLPFKLGRDGLLYDVHGRAWISESDQLLPLSRLEHWALARRLIQHGRERGSELLRGITASTRALYQAARGDPSVGLRVRVRSEARARTADAEGRLDPEPAVAQLLAVRLDTRALSAAERFSGRPLDGTAFSSTLAQYAQDDLELYRLERDLRSGGQAPLADQVHSERERLFACAKEWLELHKDPARAAFDNPHGLRFRFESLMYERSPLRFGTLVEAIACDGDSLLTVWRGDRGTLPPSPASWNRLICTVDLGLLSHQLAGLEKGGKPHDERLLAWTGAEEEPTAASVHPRAYQLELPKDELLPLRATSAAAGLHRLAPHQIQATYTVGYLGESLVK
jgi:hypothetical protein